MEVGKFRINQCKMFTWLRCYLESTGNTVKLEKKSMHKCGRVKNTQTRTHRLPYNLN
jgi:hypothetical protein